MDYLLKVTVVWSVFLLLFEAFYKNNGRFAANRFYLMATLAAGFLLPLIPITATVPQVSAIPAFRSLAPVAAVAGLPSISTPEVAFGNHETGNGPLILMAIYAVGLAVFLIRFLREAIKMMRLMGRQPRLQIAGQQVIITGKQHAPFSFLGMIFLPATQGYSSEELEYIIRHEAVHNTKRHWLDLLTLELLGIVCWFHPLIWRYRYLLRLQQEYEADHLAAQDNRYAYGHFLVRQTLLRGVPSFAPSFHFSPIKNRINMLTKQQQSSRAWKYLLIVPALLGCTLLFAKAGSNTGRVRKGNVTTYNNQTFLWKTIDQPGRPKTQVIYSANGMPVYQNELLKSPAKYGQQEQDYGEYLRKEFRKYRKESGDTLTAVNVLNMVISKEGKVLYYDLKCARPANKYGLKEWYPYGDQEPTLNAVMDQIIRDSPDWKPATINGEPVNSLVSFGGGC